MTEPFAGFRQFLAELDRPSVRGVAIAYPVAAHVARPVTGRLSFCLPDPIRRGPGLGIWFGGCARTAGMSDTEKTRTGDAAQGCEPRTREFGRLAGGRPRIR